ncbi:MAG: nicotinamide-nucleotide amidohydrolase family protein [Candidatus Omnitrophica bacterium]|nr:nicotinamide-nucleotide amidohydrolase family protein [Candidatus Omnitrophota bacterium]
MAAVIRRFYTRAHRMLQRAALRQASLPRGATSLPNPIGTAPGVWLELPRLLIIALPGVPAEMRAILDRSVLPRLARLGVAQAIESRTLRTVGIVELSIESILRGMRLPPSVQAGLYPNLRAVDIRLTATARSHRIARRMLSRLDTALRRRLGALIYGTDGETLEGVVGALLRSQRKTLAVAESCTGGLLSSWITDVPGSSRYFLGSVIAYHNQVKRASLGIPGTQLSRVGAVSAQTARSMAEGVRRRLGADIGVAVTGIAGPTGGTTQKPVGLVYVGLADRLEGVRSLRCRFLGDRAAIKHQAAQTALDRLRLHLLTQHR